MKNTILTLALLFSAGLAAQSAKAILGTWETEEGKSHVEVYKKGNKYYGKIVYLRDNKNEDGSSPKLDHKNPDPQEAQKPIVGKVIVKDLQWDASEEEWNEGSIYDPASGSTYSVFGRMESPDRLFIKGYIGFSLLGRSTIWKRVE